MSTPEKQDNLDRILLDQETLLPSSGFAVSVMDAIQNDASAPEPIPFPWKRALPGIAALLVAMAIVCRLAVSAVQGIGQGAISSSRFISAWSTWLYSNASSASLLRTQVAPASLAIAASLACVALCVKWAGGWSTR
jgi:hypothetical protein